MNPPDRDPEDGAGPIPPDPASPASPWLNHWPHHGGLELAALPSAVPCARAWLREILWEWKLDAICDDAEIALSELMTNAVEAAGGVVRVWVLGGDKRLMVLVGDDAPSPPTPRAAAAEDESGRGLLLVAALAVRWDWYRPPPPWHGKVVWAAFEASDEL